MFHVSSGSAAGPSPGERSRRRRHRRDDAHYLWFTEVMREKGNVARVQPPIRDAEERDRLWEVGIDDGVIDCIATDHAPHTPGKESRRPLRQHLGRDLGVRRPRDFGCRPCSPSSIRVDSRSSGSADTRRIRPRSGDVPPEGVAAEVGTDADLTIVDPNLEWTADGADFHSKNCVTPFEARVFPGESGRDRRPRRGRLRGR